MEKKNSAAKLVAAAGLMFGLGVGAIYTAGRLSNGLSNRKDQRKPAYSLSEQKPKGQQEVPKPTHVPVQEKKQISGNDAKPVYKPLEEAKENQESKVESGFYSKQLNVDGIPVVASSNVDSRALAEAGAVINSMLSHRPDIGKRLAEAGFKFAVIGRGEKVTDLPEYRELAGRKSDDGRPYSEMRGLGAIKERPVSSVGEENLLGLSGDMYDREKLCYHEFAHAVFNLGLAEEERKAIESLYSEAKAQGLWKGAHAIANVEEYFAEASQSFFGINDPRINQVHNGIDKPEELKAHDPRVYEFLEKVYGKR
jgi:hypothetical protein